MYSETYAGSLAYAVQVRPNISRSVHLERDYEQTAVASSYVLTGQARRSLSRIVEQLRSARPVRAWTLTGPYGSGKSLFGLFLMNITCATSSGHAFATAQLSEVDAALAQSVRSSVGLDHTQGLLPIPISGYRASLHECVQHGLREILEDHAHHPDVQRLLSQPDLWSSSVSSRTLLNGFEQLLQILRRSELGYRGLLLILDEMGKSLEYSAAHPERGDIFLLQELAELAVRSGDTPLVFIGILHQGFDRYAGQLDALGQREWAKVQGRFEDIPFQEPPNQQLALLVDALQVQRGGVSPDVDECVARYAAEAVEGNWCPPLMKRQDFEQLCLRAFPFHPTALVALPYLFRRLAQNERSLFAYLTSLEPYGFQEFLNTQRWPRFVRLPDLFDYLAANYQGRLYSSLRARPLTEALDRLETTSELSPAAIGIVKTIALLTWLADSGPFTASEASVLFALSGEEYDEGILRDTLRQLRAQSVIVFRRFNSTYAIWQGSDVDIDAQVAQAEQRLTGVFSLAQAVQTYLQPQPVIARRHSYVTGSTRFFEVRYVDVLTRDHLSLQPAAGACGLVLLCLSSNAVEAASFVKWAQDSALQNRSNVVVGVAQRTVRLAELLNELRCLHWVSEHTPELRDDPVSRRELRTRINSLESVIKHELENTLSLHRLVDAAGCRWIWRGDEIADGTWRSLSQMLSHVADVIYTASPCVRNELINRRLLSSQGAAARRNLVEAMLTRREQAQLGIEGFPPERSMYESLLQSSGLHTEQAPGVWAFAAPPGQNPVQLAPAWNALATAVFAVPPVLHKVDVLFELLAGAPYGLTDGVLPVMLCAFMSVHQDEVTLYREGTLLPDPGIADWEVLMRRPELFAIAGCRIVGPRLAVVQRLARGLQTQPAAMPIVRELIRRLKSLPDHAWRTQRLTQATLDARRTIETARSPESLLFHDLPAVFGLPPFAEDVEGDADQVALFFARLNATLQELNDATPKLIAQARDTLLAALGLPVAEEGWRQFRRMAAELAPRVQQPTLAPLLRRTQEAADERQALESALAYIANRPPKSWTDGDTDRFGAQAQGIGDLWRNAQGEEVLESILTEQQREQSQRISSEVYRSLRNAIEHDPAVVKAALRRLLKDLEQD